VFDLGDVCLGEIGRFIVIVEIFGFSQTIHNPTCLGNGAISDLGDVVGEVSYLGDVVGEVSYLGDVVGEVVGEVIGEIFDLGEVVGEVSYLNYGHVVLILQFLLFLFLLFFLFTF
jgi:hypothetical protein